MTSISPAPMTSGSQAPSRIFKRFDEKKVRSTPMIGTRRQRVWARFHFHIRRTMT